MKYTKRFLILLLCLCFLASCNKAETLSSITLSESIESVFEETTNVSDSDLYSVKVNDTELLENIKYNELSEEQLQIGTQYFLVKKVGTHIYSDGSCVDFFQSIDGETKYTVFGGENKFKISANGTATLKPFPQEIFTEETLIRHVKEYAMSMISDFNFEATEYNCLTSVRVTEKNATWNEMRVGFAEANSINEEVLSYTISFTIYANSFATEDKVEITCDRFGNVETFYYCNAGCDWETITVDQDKLSESILRLLQENWKSSYQFSSYAIEKQTLVNKNGEIKLVVVLEVMIDINGEEYPLLCSLLVDLA